MNKRLKELAEQAGFEISSSNFADLGWVWCSDEYPIDEKLEALVKLVRQDEREANAKLLNDFAKTTLVPVVDSFKAGLKAGAYAILSRGEK
jgi:hypothetical protein